MTVASELQDAARAIRRSVPADASFHLRVAELFDQVALSAPLVDGPNGASPFLPPITRKALAAARAFLHPTGSAVPAGSAEGVAARAGAGVAASAPAATPGPGPERADEVREHLRDVHGYRNTNWLSDGDAERMHRRVHVSPDRSEDRGHDQPAALHIWVGAP